MSYRRGGNHYQPDDASDPTLLTNGAQRFTFGDIAARVNLPDSLDPRGVVVPFPYVDDNGTPLVTNLKVRKGEIMCPGCGEWRPFVQATRRGPGCADCAQRWRVSAWADAITAPVRLSKKKGKR